MIEDRSDIQSSLRPQMGHIRKFPVFLSYGDEASPLKDRIKRLVEEAFAKQLAHEEWPVLMTVIDWRDVAGQRAPIGGKTNDIFVNKARTSSAAIVLLLDRVPPGTAEEIDAVMADPKIDVTVFWLNRKRWLSTFRGRTQTSQYLDDRKDYFSWVELNELDSEDTWVAISSNVVAVLLKALRGGDRPSFFETRQ